MHASCLAVSPADHWAMSLLSPGQFDCLSGRCCYAMSARLPVCGGVCVLFALPGLGLRVMLSSMYISDTRLEP